MHKFAIHKKRSRDRVARWRSAKPLTAVRIRPRPQHNPQPRSGWGFFMVYPRKLAYKRIYHKKDQLPAGSEDFVERLPQTGSQRAKRVVIRFLASSRIYHKKDQLPAGSEDFVERLPQTGSQRAKRVVIRFLASSRIYYKKDQLSAPIALFLSIRTSMLNQNIYFMQFLKYEILPCCTTREH